MRAQPAKILVVDDETIVTDTLRVELVREGYEVLEAADGTTAIDIFVSEHDRIDLVLLDLMLPDIHGLEVLEELQAIHEGVRVIIITGVTNTDDVPEHLSIVRKPFAMNGLLETVEGSLS
ncbi:response regulator [Candidatus Latescibacterota bacterium]